MVKKILIFIMLLSFLSPVRIAGAQNADLGSEIRSLNETLQAALEDKKRSLKKLRETTGVKLREIETYKDGYLSKKKKIIKDATEEQEKINALYERIKKRVDAKKQSLLLKEENIVQVPVSRDPKSSEERINGLNEELKALKSERQKAIILLKNDTDDKLRAWEKNGGPQLTKDIILREADARQQRIMQDYMERERDIVVRKTDIMKEEYAGSRKKRQ